MSKNIKKDRPYVHLGVGDRCLMNLCARKILPLYYEEERDSLPYIVVSCLAVSNEFEKFGVDGILIGKRIRNLKRNF